MSQDISTFKELDRLREELAAIVAHDARSPVQAMLLHQIDALELGVGAEGARADSDGWTKRSRRRQAVRVLHFPASLLHYLTCSSKTQ